MKLLAAKEWNKVFYADGEKYRLQVRAELIHLDGNSSPYFSIGGDIFRLARNGRKVWESGGCIHEEIVKHFPHYFKYWRTSPNECRWSFQFIHAQTVG